MLKLFQKGNLFPRNSNLYELSTYRMFCANMDEEENCEEFELMPFAPHKKIVKITRERGNYPHPEPRYKRMSVTQDWNTVWPTARTFNPNVVPLPMYQSGLGVYNNSAPRKDKFSNLELLKIQNFLHLAPSNVKKQCRAIKKFCSPWPKELNSDEEIEKYFSMEIDTSDYCHASPTIRDPRARVVTIRFKLSSLELDEHARDKMIRLLDTRYDPKTDLVTITTNGCPLKKQNIDYALYQLTICYFESWKFEDWENDKLPQDWERFFYEKSASKRKADKYIEVTSPDEKSRETRQKAAEEYAEALSGIFEGEGQKQYENYGKSVEKLLFG